MQLLVGWPLCGEGVCPIPALKSTAFKLPWAGACSKCKGRASSQGRRSFLRFYSYPTPLQAREAPGNEADEDEDEVTTTKLVRFGFASVQHIVEACSFQQPRNTATTTGKTTTEATTTAEARHADAFALPSSCHPTPPIP